MATLVFEALASADRVPPLANGDWLKRKGFHRRYLTMPEVKKEVYLAHGVREYLVWSVEDQRLDWWELREGQCVTIPLDADDLARSRIFPGLWLDARALLAGDLAAVLAGVGKGLASD